MRRSRERLADLAPAVLFANRDEAAAILRRAGRRAWAGLLAHASLVVVKDGAWGCRVLWRDAATGTLRQLDVAAQRVGNGSTRPAPATPSPPASCSLACAGGPLPASSPERADLAMA